MSVNILITLQKKWLSGRRLTTYAEYGILAMLIMLPLLFRPGYIFALDTIISPVLPLPSSIDNNYVWLFINHYLSLIISSQLIEKGIWLAILVLSGVGMHRLAQRALPAGAAPWGAYFAGVLYMVNPFTYERFVYGQFLLLLGYSLLPFFASALLDFLDNPRRKSALMLALWTMFIIIISIHSIFFMLIIGTAFGAFRAMRQWKNPGYLRRLAGYFALVASVVLLLNSYWLLPLALSHGQIAQSISMFDKRQVSNFQTAADSSVGVLANTAAMYGFWEERQPRYTLPKTLVPWVPLFLMIFGLVIWGAVASWRKDKAMTAAMAALGIVSFILAVGVAYGPFAGIYYWMVDHVPFFRGFREPQKFVGLLVLVYAFFAAFGVGELLQWVKRNAEGWLARAAQGLPVAVLLLPLLYTPTMLWGFAGQLPPGDYPPDWYALNRQLDADQTRFKVLFLPWHQYMSFGFAQAIIANPAQNFFDKPVIQGDNFELGDIQTQVNNPVSNYIVGTVLAPRAKITDAGARLAPQHVKYVVLAKEIDWKKYDFLNRQTDLKLIKDTSNLRVYLNLSFKE